ncbi:membrane fusion protein, multidrug efflux system [Enhydrobacter aerosaccus]|uniref:Membrane fusion protein, multidrug efflux system n=2 Tax=Enhydrobacter aerosaccus TaxID=225324 RepID=A0A1T4TJM8_9HYPH|nr:membrane fusion protein, multidrug efflux system [Enhydrobacter aerosaccus]
MTLALAACHEDKQTPQPVPEVGVVTLVAQPVTLTTALTGRTAATMSSGVRPRVAGIIRARLFTEGSVVQAGEALYEIDPRPYRAILDQTQAQLESAQATFASAQAKADRYLKLTVTQSVSRQDVDDATAAAQAARASVRQHQAALETAHLNLEFTRVLAPISGRIGRSNVTPGALVTADQSTALATIQQLDPIYVDISQSSFQLLKLRQAVAKGEVLPASSEVRLKLEDGSDYPLTGRIEFSEVAVDENTGTVTLRARFPNPDGLLLPGMFVRIEAPQAVVPAGILAPQQGIVRDARGNATALVVDANDKVAQREVTAAQTIGNTWLITNGLTAGDRLIVEGIGKVQAGTLVKPVPVNL